ncbi:MAG: hypothetical protein K2R98_30210 [Gemmataceae bacterium]|nr:hypothetical protein [Gemmataceae bacterium]
MHTRWIEAGRIRLLVVGGLVLMTLLASTPCHSVPEVASASWRLNAEKERANLAEPMNNRRLRVGMVFIVGNEQSPQSVILRQIPFERGDVIRPIHLHAAQENLRRLGLFVVDPCRGIEPTVEVLDPDAMGNDKDILVNIKERPGNQLIFSLYDLLLLPFSDRIGGSLYRTVQEVVWTGKDMVDALGRTSASPQYIAGVIATFVEVAARRLCLISDES